MRRDLSLRRGTTLVLPLRARKEDGAVIDLTGASIVWRIGGLDRKTTKITKTLQVTDATAGKFTVRLDPADTADLAPDSYAHAAEVTEAGGTVSTVLHGCLDLQRELP